MTSITSRLIERAKPIWPVIACTVGMTFLSAVFFFMMEHRWLMSGMSRYAEAAIVSCILAQIALVTILGGLISKHWLTGWLLAVVLTCMQTVMAMVIAEFPRLTSDAAVQHLALCSMWPAFLLATCAPLIALRTLFGWTLRRQSQKAIPRWRSSLEDLILLGVVIACSMTISQMFLYSEGPQNLPQLLLVMAIFAATSLICIPPVVYVSFRSRNWTRRIVGWMLLTLVGFVVIFVEGGIMEGGNFRHALSAIPDMIFGMLTASLTMAIGMVSLMASGYQLTHFERATQSPSTIESDAIPATTAGRVDGPVSKESTAPFAAEWLDDSQPETSTRTNELTPQWQARWIALGLIAVAAAGAMGIHFLRQRTLQFYEGFHQLNAEQVYSSQQNITGLKFSPDFTDEDLQPYLRYSNTITSLSFAGTKITDAILPQLRSFTQLNNLDLSNTAITDAGIKQFRFPNLNVTMAEETIGFKRLSLADTKVTMAGVAELLKRNSIGFLDLSGLQLSDADLATRLPVASLKLSRNPITDAGLISLLQTSKLRHLDVSDTSITGSGLNLPECPERLNLDGTAINDVWLTAILKNPGVHHFSLRRTRVTAAVLPLLAGKSLRLGKGPITESDLISLGRADFLHLGLNDKQFTGKCLTAGAISTASLDLSNSSVTDDVLIALGSKGPFFQFLGLANTQVTDACLPYLMSTSEIDVRGTRITISGLATRNAHGFVVSHDQFTPKELTGLNSPHLEFNERPKYSIWPE